MEYFKSRISNIRFKEFVLGSTLLYLSIIFIHLFFFFIEVFNYLILLFDR